MKQKGRLFLGCILLFFLASLGLFLNFDRDRVMAAAEARHIPVPQVLSSKPDVALIGDDFSLPPVDNDKPVYDKYTTRQRQEKGLPTTYGKTRDYYYGDNVVYLTFDDGPSEENTNAVLDVLKNRNIKATFFVVGENVLKHPETAQRIVAEGHTIGIHCYRHDYEALYESVDSYLKDFDKAYRAVLEVTGEKARLYRFPGGSINSHNREVYSDIIAAMDARGFIYFDWNASLDDALRKSSPEELLDNAKKTMMGRRKVVLLGHDIVHSTSLCLDQLISQFQEYSMEPLTPEVEPVRFRP